MNYCPLLTIQLSHSYYKNGKSADFQLVPSVESQRVLDGHRLRWREKWSAWQIITSLDDSQKPFLPIDQATVLRFYLSINTPGVIHVTDWNQVAGETVDFSKVLAGHYFLHFTHAGTSTLKGGIYRHFETETLKVITPGLEEVFFLQGPILPGATSADITVEGAQVGLQYDPDQKKLVLNTLQVAPGTVLKVRYPAIPGWAQVVIGVVDIPLSDPNATQQVFYLNFPVRNAVWRYYVATNRPLATMEMKDIPESSVESESASVVFAPPDDIRALHDETPVDSMAEWMKRKFSSANTLVRFRSNTPVAFSDKLQKNICLLSQSRVLLTHLPVPSLEKPETQIVTSLS